MSLDVIGCRWMLLDLGCGGENAGDGLRFARAHVYQTGIAYLYYAADTRGGCAGKDPAW